MADHITKQAIDAWAAILLAGSTDASDRIYTGRVTPFQEDELPAINIDGGEEEIALSSIHSPAIEERNATINTECVVRALDGYDADAYTLLKQVENLLGANPTLTAKAKNASATAVNWERAVEGDVPIVRATLVMRADLVVLNNAVDVAI